jgi:hypothetical protein
MKKEIWKDIPNYEGLYQVSNLGRVKSVKENNNRLKKPNSSGRGYFSVILYKNNKHKTFLVHRLVAFAFLNYKHTPGFVVDHINNNPLDNRLENLQVITIRENSSKDRKNCSSKYTGVCFDKRDKLYNSSIRINGKKMHLGCFKNEYDAHLAYQKKLKEIIVNK